MVPCSGIIGEHTFSNKANTGGSMTEDLLLTGPQHHFPDPLDHGGLDAQELNLSSMVMRRLMLLLVTILITHLTLIMIRLVTMKMLEMRSWMWIHLIHKITFVIFIIHYKRYKVLSIFAGDKRDWMKLIFFFQTA